MRPDLFAGSTRRDDSHRILARLANGGGLPAPVRQWDGRTALQRSRIAAVVALLAISSAAWIWRQDEGASRHPAPEVAARPEPAALPAYAPPPQAAAIINETPRLMPAAPSSVASAVPAVPHPAHPRATKPAPLPHGQSHPIALENDEDVTLLTAMLRHANPQKDSATPPKD